MNTCLQHMDVKEIEEKSAKYVAYFESLKYNGNMWTHILYDLPILRTIEEKELYTRMYNLFYK